jgi:hypothetical protein
MSETPEKSQKRRYVQLQPEERLTIASLLQQRKSLGEIARSGPPEVDDQPGSAA